MTKHLSARSSRLSLLLLLLLAPGVGLAQEVPATEQQPPPASSGLPGTQERTSPRLSEDSWAQEEASRPPRGLRILAETGAGLLTGLGVGFAGLLAGNRLCRAGVFGSNRDFIPCLGEAVGGLVLGAGVGFSLGVWWGGEAAGGDGKLLGMLAGIGAGAVLGFFVGVGAASPSTGFALAIPLSMIGAIVGYESTQRGPVPAPQAPALASTPPRFQPVLAFSRHGALVGLGGSF